jgi:peptide/nickel transport system permease protein
VNAAGLGPSTAHPFGTDQFSRDVLSRVLHGGRVSLGVALLSVVVALTVGTAYGAVAGWAGGRADGLMMRLVDGALAIPRILLLIVIFSLWRGAGVVTLVLVIGLTGWFGVARVVRGEVRALRTRDFVTAATALGAPGARVLVRHVLPNVASAIVVAATLAVGNVVVLEAGLSYLGIGVQPPQPSWGNIIFEGREVFRTLWWISAFPGLAIVGTVMALNAAGDGLRDALDPRQH